MNTDSLDDHPDLQDLRLSRREQREAQAEARRRRRRAVGRSPRPPFVRGHRRTVLAVGSVAALVVVGALVVDGARPGVTETSPSITGTAVAEGPGVDLSQPFLGTPAAGWADGESGITPPAAAAAGRYTADEVAAAYERVRRLLVTARLDPAVLENHDFGRFLALLAPNARTGMDLSRPSQEAFTMASRIADGFDLLPVPPKVVGDMSAEEGADGVLVIHTNYVFAYAFAPTDPDEIQDSMELVAVTRFEADYTVVDANWPEADRGVWVTEVHGFGYSIACEAFRRGELAPSYSEPVPTDAEPLNKTTAFDPNAEWPTSPTC